MKTQLRRLVARQLERRVQKLIHRNRLKVVAVTGSVGKTSTKLAIASVLGQKYKVLAHEGNYNMEVSLPLSIFGLDVPATLTNPISWLKLMRQIDAKLRRPYRYEVLVLELGADQPADIQKFMRYLTPDIGIVTAIAAVHTEQFGTVDAIAHEKMALARGSRAVLINGDDERVRQEAGNLGQPFQTYGLASGNVYFTGLKRDAKGFLGGQLHLHNYQLAISTHLAAKHGLYAVLAAAAVGEELGLEKEQIKAGIAGIRPVPGRMNLLAGAGGSLIIDDTYNSSPRAALAALETLRDVAGRGHRRIAIMGSMNELGGYAEKGHREAGAACHDLDLLLTIGDNAGRYIAAGAAGAGLAAAKIHRFDSPYAAGEFAKSQIKAGDVVLAKGSQNGVFTEEAVALLLAKPSDRAKLVRQGADWQRRKRRQFEDAPT